MSHPSTGQKRVRVSIEGASAWVLRIGVMASVLVMLTGMAVSFARHHAPLERIESAKFNGNLGDIWQGLCAGRGQAIIELGVYMLVLTPITRVFTSMLLFVFDERDWLYGIVTLAVLAMTLTGLLLFR